MSGDRFQRFPVVSLCEDCQARRDAAELFHNLEATATCYDVSQDRMKRALAVLAARWPALAARGGGIAAKCDTHRSAA